MNFSRVYIVTTVTQEHIEAILDAIASVGGGVIGHYTHCAFTHNGQGRFKPLAEANPRFGEKGEIHTFDEWRIETFCERAIAKAVIQAIKSVHPYDQPVIYVMPLLDEADL